MTRLQWLRRAVPSLRKLIRERGHDLPLTHRRLTMKVGLAGQGPFKREVLGATECPNGHATIEISTAVRSSQLALAVLLHEMVHATQPRFSHEHGPEFRKLAKRLGFGSPYKNIAIAPTLTGDGLALRLRTIGRRLGPYPQE